jgi:hypothetical protein
VRIEVVGPATGAIEVFGAATAGAMEALGAATVVAIII